MSNAGSRILRSVRNARAAARGEGGELVLHVPETVDVKAVRARTGLSQEAFALRYGFTPAAVRDWEQNRRRPEQAARVLLLVIDREPKAVDRALGSLRGAKQRFAGKVEASRAGNA
jgi:putative transcriptional regulator